MSSNFHYPIDLNEDQNQPFFYSQGSFLHQASSSSSRKSSSSYSSLSHQLPFLISSQQEHVGYNTVTTTYHGDHDHLSQPLEEKILVSNGGSSCDHMVPKKETSLKLTIRKKEEKTDHHHRHLLQNQTKGESGQSPTTTTAATTVKWMSSKMRLMKRMPNTYKQPMGQNLQEDRDDFIQKNSQNPNSVYENIGYGNNTGVIRVCSDCNTTKTPLWRSGPRGPKSLCNACGIRQRKARRAAMAVAAAASTTTDDSLQPPQPQPQPKAGKRKMQNKNKRSSSNHINEKGQHFMTQPPKAKKCKITTSPEVLDSETPSKSSPSSSSNSSSDKLCFDDLTMILSKSSAFQQVFPQDEKEAAILLMALSYGMVHG